MDKPGTINEYCTFENSVLLAASRSASMMQPNIIRAATTKYTIRGINDAQLNDEFNELLASNTMNTTMIAQAQAADTSRNGVYSQR